MQTPRELTLEGFYQARAVFMRDQCMTSPTTGQVLCRECGARIKVMLAKIEIHEAGKERCQGNGEHFKAGIPYCPCGERLPAETGCVHA